MTERNRTGFDAARLSNDDLFEVLGSQTRRIVLFHLRQHGVATFSDLVDTVLEFADTEAEVGTRRRAARKRVALVLSERHLPILESKKLVVFDRIHDTVELGDTPDDFGDWLDLAVRRELQWERELETSQEYDESQNLITVLVADDEPGLAETIGDMLTSRNDDMTVATATSARDAFTVLESMDIDCVVSDYRMPGISGIGFLEAVRKMSPKLPFILFTGKGSEEIASKAIANDVTAYVPKGTGTEQYDRLEAAIRRAVEQSREGERSREDE